MRPALVFPRPRQSVARRAQLFPYYNDRDADAKGDDRQEDQQGLNEVEHHDTSSSTTGSMSSGRSRLTVRRFQPAVRVMKGCSILASATRGGVAPTRAR
jgi:hypothetical protein